MFAQMPLFVYRHFTGAVCTTSSDGRFALFTAPSTAAFSVASRLSNSSDILLRASSEPPPPWVACCAHQVQNFDLSRRFWCRGLWGRGKFFAEMNKTRGDSDYGMFGPTCECRAGRAELITHTRSANLPRPTMAGAFSVHGSDEQIFGADKQVSGHGPSD